jgi:hypothetical protein
LRRAAALAIGEDAERGARRVVCVVSFGSGFRSVKVVLKSRAASHRRASSPGGGTAPRWRLQSQMS